MALSHADVAVAKSSPIMEIAIGGAVIRVSADIGEAELRRVIRADTRRVAYLVDTLPEDVLHLNDLPADFRGSVLDLLLGRGDLLKTSRANISALGATADVAKALEIQRGDVLLHFYSKLFNESNKIVDYSLSYFIPGYFNFHVVRRVGG